MSTSLITGYANGPHVTSKQQGACNAASFTAGKYVLNIGECFAYELVSNNLIRVKEGMAINQGRYMCIDRNDYEELTIDNGLQGVKRSDLIVIRYEKNQNTGIETSKMMVIKGTSGDSYVDPEHQEGNILEGDLIDDLLLYRVNLNGLNVESVEVLFNMKNNMDSIEKKIGSTDISGIGDGTFTGGLAALNNSLHQCFQIKYTTISGTTDENGALVLPTIENRIYITGRPITLWYYCPTTIFVAASGEWYALIENISTNTHSPVKNAPISIGVFYLEPIS